MTQRIDDLKKAWDERQGRLGHSRRAVLFKRFPGWLNESIHRRHVRFIRDNLPIDPKTVLDVGCGYGRISSELKKSNPGIVFQGVDFCAEFAAAYERDIGNCFNGPIQEFNSEDSYDTIIIVTTLMYLDTGEHNLILGRLWSMLNPGGRLICIEPASEIFTIWRALTGRHSASPTGGSIRHFGRNEFVSMLSALENASIKAVDSILLIPKIPFSALHRF